MMIMTWANFCHECEKKELARAA